MVTNAPGEGTRGKPDGPPVFIPEFGQEVGTFTQARPDLMGSPETGGSTDTLMYHVPHDLRGIYKPNATKDYDGDRFEYLVDDAGYALCTAQKRIRGGTRNCAARAVNMSWKCPQHGGRLHPLDRSDSYSDGKRKYAGNKMLRPETARTRMEMLIVGTLDVSELDDEELLRGECRNVNGNFSGTGATGGQKLIPKAMHSRMVNELLKRGREKLQSGLFDAIDVVLEVAKNDAFEPADRLKAATWVAERVMGKNPDVVVHTQDKPWETILTGVSGGSRAESRAARGLEGAIDAEVVPEPVDEDGYIIDPTEYAYEDMPSDLIEADLVDDNIRAEPEPQMEAETLPGEIEADRAARMKAEREKMKAALKERIIARNSGQTTIEKTPAKQTSEPVEDGYKQKLDFE